MPTYRSIAGGGVTLSLASLDIKRVVFVCFLCVTVSQVQRWLILDKRKCITFDSHGRKCCIMNDWINELFLYEKWLNLNRSKSQFIIRNNYETNHQYSEMHLHSFKLLNWRISHFEKKNRQLAIVLFMSIVLYSNFGHHSKINLNSEIHLLHIRIARIIFISILL